MATTRRPWAGSSGLHTTAVAAARLDGSTIDYAVLPAMSAMAEDDGALARLRMPLTPNDFGVVGHEPDAPDAPLAAPEIVVLAAHPEAVAPAALTEVEGMGVDCVELSFAHDPAPAAREQGMLRDLWEGLVDDVFGRPKPGA